MIAGLRIRRCSGKSGPLTAEQQVAHDKEWGCLVKRVIVASAALITVVAVAVAGYYAYGRYTDGKLIDAQVPAVKNTSLRLANTLNLANSGKVTYRELFDKIDKDASEIEQKRMDVQTAATPSTARWMSAIGAYLLASQEALRAESIFVRKQLTVTTAIGNITDAQRRYSQADNPYAVKTYRDAWDDAIRRAREDVTELHTAGSDFDAALRKLEEARQTITTFVPADALVDPGLIASSRQATQKFAQINL